MSTPSSSFREGNLLSIRIRDLGLSLAGTRLEPVVAEFLQELERLGVRPRPHVYLSTEWGVPFGTISIAIPFYLARPDLTAVHGERAGYLEGVGRAALLRYLRHEMGHVVNYAYKLYDRGDWVKLFGAITQPYEEEYRAAPFSRRHVVHLPGWYAQKHPDEDWAETFAVWMTSELDWRAAYADWPDALAKLEYCDRTLAELQTREPEVTAIDPDEDVGSLSASLEDFYSEYEPDDEDLPHGLDGALRSIFEDLGHPEDATSDAPRRPAADLIRRLELDVAANVYRWAGHFPEYTRGLVRRLAERAEQLHQVCPADRETSAAVAVTALVTALAMNHVLRGSYAP